MSVTDFYSPFCQFKRALNRDWRLHSAELLCGILYPMVGFYVARQVGQSQVYSVIWPFVVTAGFMVYLTRRLCLPEVKRESVFSYFNLPQDRLLALNAHLAFLCIAAVWLSVCVFVGSSLKLGGAGFTNCYRFHPEFVVLPFLVAALAIRHVYLIHSLAFWCKSAVWYVLVMVWLVWKYWLCQQPANAFNNYWPDRGMSLPVELAMAVLMAGVAVWLIASTRIQWRGRQIGGIR